MNWIIFVLIYYIIFSVLATIFILFDGINSVGLLPKEIYEGSKFNIVTCWILSILLFIAVPLLFIIKFICWITHVGRRK